MSCETGGIQKGPNDSYFFTDEQVKAIRDFFRGKKPDVDEAVKSPKHCVSEWDHAELVEL